MKSSKITAVHGIGSLLGHAAVDVTLYPDTRFALAFDDKLTSELIGAIAAAGAYSLDKRAKKKEKVDPPEPLPCERLGFYPSRTMPDRIVVAASVRDGVMIPLSIPKSSIQTLVENLQAIMATPASPKPN